MKKDANLKNLAMAAILGLLLGACAHQESNQTISEMENDTPGVGIAGMKERLRQLGGSLTVESSGQGTVVRAVIPHPL